VEILKVRPVGHDGRYDHTASVLCAYFEAQRARASRRFLWCAVPIMTLLLIAVQFEDGLIAGSSVAALVALAATIVAAGHRR
jgi:hypothetical protein